MGRGGGDLYYIVLLGLILSFIKDSHFSFIFEGDRVLDIYSKVCGENLTY